MAREERNQDARNLLAYFYAGYEQVGNRSFSITPQERGVLKEIGMEMRQYMAAMHRLVDKGLLEPFTLGGGCRITEFGVDASEDPELLDELLPVASAPTLSSPRGGVAHMGEPTVEEKPDADPKKVFIIHGRNGEAAKEMARYVRALGLEPVVFSELRGRMGGTPTVADIVSQGMIEAQGVIALFTSDEYAELRPELRGERDKGTQVARWQARPNVIFEAGMAFGRDRDRVVFVLLGDVELFTDVAGIHFLSPTNDPSGDRDTLRRTLKSMGCRISDSSTWMSEGDFEGCLRESAVTLSSAFEETRGAQQMAERNLDAVLRAPAEFDALTEADRETAKEILKGIDDWISADHESYHVNTNEDRVTPRRVWRAVVKAASDRGWDSTFRGPIVTIKKPQ